MPQQSGDNASLATFSIDGWASHTTPILTLWVEQNSNSGYPCLHSPSSYLPTTKKGPFI
jgi:hypothetical protein